MEMGKIGAWVSTNALGREQLVELARGVEELGYDTLWYPESTTYESIAMGGFLLAHSEKLKVASGIAGGPHVTEASASTCAADASRDAVLLKSNFSARAPDFSSCCCNLALFS